MSSGTVTPYVDFGANANDTNENNTASIQPLTNGEGINQTVLQRPDENLRQRTEVIRGRQIDSLALENMDRVLLISGPGKVTWPGSTTAGATGIPTLSDVLWIIPSLTPGFAQAAPVPPVASAFGVLHLQRATGPSNAILVTSQRRSYAAGDQINVTVTPGAVYSCTLDTEVTGALQRTIKIVATGATTLGTVIASLNALTPPSPDNTALVTAALEGGASSGDLILTTQARQFVSGNYDGEGHTVTPANLASFFSGNPSQVLAEGDSLCVWYPALFDPATTGGRRQSIPENSNTTVPAASFFNSRVHPEKLFNALPLCKVINGSLVFGTGVEIQAGATGGLSPIDGPSRILRNGNFEYGVTNDVTRYGITDWENVNSAGAAWRLGTTGPLTGAKSLELNKIILGASAARLDQEQEIAVNPGQTIRVVVHVKQLIAPSAGTYSLNLYWGDANSVAASLTTIALQVLASTDASYRTVDATIVVPAAKRMLKTVSLEAAGVVTAATGTALLVDDVQVYVETQTQQTPAVNQARLKPTTVDAVIMEEPNGYQLGNAAALMKYVGAINDLTPNLNNAPEGAVIINRKDEAPTSSNMPPALAVIGRLFALGGEILDTDAHARIARVGTLYSAAFALTLMYEALPDSVGTPGVRMFTNLAGAHILTINASWDGTNFNKDVSGTGALFVLYGPEGIQMYTKPADENAAWNTFTQQLSLQGARTVTAANPHFNPLQSFVDSGGHLRVAFDHLGLPGRHTQMEIHQNWLPPNYAAWTDDVNGSATIAMTLDVAANKPGPWLALTTTANNEHASKHLEPRPVTAWNANLLGIMEFDVDGTVLVGTPALTFGGGFRHDEVGEPSTEDCVQVYKTSASANWFLQTTQSSDNTTLQTDTGIPVAAAVTRFRIEVYGANWQGAARALLWINGALVAQNTTKLPNINAMSTVFILKSTGATGSKVVYVSPTWIRFVRQLADDSI